MTNDAFGGTHDYQKQFYRATVMTAMAQTSPSGFALDCPL
jgi:hypothetical protein